MKPSAKGSFCDQCSKHVVDFTNLNQLEISEIMKSSGNRMCARVTGSQLNAPLFNLERNFQLDFPNSRVAAGLILATSLTIGHTSFAKSHAVKTEFIQTKELKSSLNKPRPISKPSHPKKKDTILFEGRITSKDLNKAVENAKIILVTSQKILTAYTSKEGKFVLEIPLNLIDEDNVIRVSYNEIKRKPERDPFFHYESKDYILSSDDLKTEFKIEAEPEVLYLGGFVTYVYRRNPIVLDNGKEIKYRQFVKASLGKKSRCNLENKDYLYFESEFAMAIYGKKAEAGLYILTEKNQQK